MVTGLLMGFIINGQPTFVGSGGEGGFRSLLLGWNRRLLIFFCSLRCIRLFVLFLLGKFRFWANLSVKYYGKSDWTQMCSFTVMFLEASSSSTTSSDAVSTSIADEMRWNLVLYEYTNKLYICITREDRRRASFGLGARWGCFPTDRRWEALASS